MTNKKIVGFSDPNLIIFEKVKYWGELFLSRNNQHCFLSWHTSGFDPLSIPF